jgi:hypothetical protein
MAAALVVLPSCSFPSCLRVSEYFGLDAGLTIGVADVRAGVVTALGGGTVGVDDAANPSAPKFAPMAIAAETRLREMALAAATTVLRSIARSFRSLEPGGLARPARCIQTTPPE